MLLSLMITNEMAPVSARNQAHTVPIPLVKFFIFSRPSWIEIHSSALLDSVMRDLMARSRPKYPSRECYALEQNTPIAGSAGNLEKVEVAVTCVSMV
jgi:hypothetical protein